MSPSFRPRLPAVLLASVALLGAASASAQTSPADAAVAEALYDDGARLLEAGDYAAACPKLAESYRLDPALGALLSLAVCRERAGQLASAWATYLDVASRAGGDTERGGAARARADALAPRLPRLEMKIAPDVLALPGLAITRDGQTVDPQVASTPVPVDPGEHVIEVRATGRRPLRQTVVAVEGKVEAVTVTALEPESAPAPVTPPVAPPGEADEGGLSGLQVAGLVTGGVGVVALGVGLTFGAVALGAASDLDVAGYDSTTGQCSSASTAACQALFDDASGPATLSTILVIAGGALAAAGAVMVIVGGDDAPGDTSASRLTVSPAPGGLLLRGAL